MTLRETLLKEYGPGGLYDCSYVHHLTETDDDVMEIGTSTTVAQSILILIRAAWKVSCLIDTSLKDIFWALIRKQIDIIYYG
jgi:hypothetical protein